MSDAVPKSYVDRIAAGVHWLKPVQRVCDIYSTYPDPENGDSVFVLADGSACVFDGKDWTRFMANGEQEVLTPSAIDLLGKLAEE